MPTLTTREHGEIHVHYHQVTRMASAVAFRIARASNRLC